MTSGPLRSKRTSRDTHRSRKGCPECRFRKIKCDETQPECTQCLKNGRACRIIDGLFRPHSLSFPTAPSPRRAEKSSKAQSPPRLAVQEELAGIWGSPSQANQPPSGGDVVGGLESTHEVRVSNTSPAQPTTDIPVEGLLVPTSAVIDYQVATGTPSAQSLPSSNLSPNVVQDYPTVISHASSNQSAIPASLLEETSRDYVEVCFFLRHFAETTGLWMDIATTQRAYFSKYVVQLARQSPLLRYSACAIAAKQLGQMKDFTSSIDRTQRSNITASALLKPGLDFLWYGAKYYEKAIRLMSQQISHTPNSTAHPSPQDIYQLRRNDHQQLEENESLSSIFRILSASILSSYEELNATMGAWSGHLNGINKLLWPHLDIPIPPEVSATIPQADRALDMSFWYFAIEDVLNSFVLSRPCRLNPDDISLWQKMGLPLNDTGQLVVNYIDEQYQEVTFFKALIRLLCKLISQDCGASTQWVHLDFEFSRWYHALPTEFLAPISQTLPPSQNNLEDLSMLEIWYGSEICAIAMAYYHMARILLLVNQPKEAFLSVQSRGPQDLLRTYNKLQRELVDHAMVIIPIAFGMPNSLVQKHMIQPLYVAGRCLPGSSERQVVVRLLRQIEDKLGYFTDYRIKDLFDEWGIPFEPRNHDCP